MKKTSLITLGLFSIVLLITSGFILNDPPTSTRMETDVAFEIKDKIPVDDFSSVAVAISAKIYIEQGNDHSLEIDASPSTLEKIKVNVKDGKLVIEPENRTVRIKDDVYVYITAPDYEEISIAGSAELFAEKKMDLDETILKIAGSGSMNFEDLQAGELGVKIAGAGDLSLKGGGADELELTIAGSGDVNTTEFEVNKLEAKISGSGDCKVWVSGQINASIAGSGSILYKGSPQVDSSVAGSGSVKKL